jgi:hypothetical protein
MPTRRVRTERAQHGITAELCEAWHQGDWHLVNRLTDTKPWQIAPMDAVSSWPADDDDSPWAESWPRAMEWRKRLIAAAGPPGRCDRHGDPLGPAKPRKPKHADQ